MSSGTGELRAGAGADLRAGTLPVVAVVLAIAGVAWAVTVVQMTGMDAGPGTGPGTLGFFAGTWTVMMIAMMLPSALPSVAAQAGAGRRAVFAVGYVAVWSLAGLLGYAALKLGGQLGGGFFAWHRAGRATAATALLLAAAYELTPAKRRFLAACRDTAARSPRSPLRAGIANGGACLGCCAGLMIALFALGEMSITWMLVVTAVVGAQKLLPWRTATIATTAVLLLGLGLGLAIAPAHVPGVTIPGSSGSTPGMGAMPG